MTTAADDSAAEEAFEAFLAGKPVPEKGATLAAFAGAVRATATQPGRPNAALAELLATGLLVDQPPLSARTAKRRRRRMWFFTAIFAKIASAGAVAQAATGAGIVLVGFTGVGAAGALPTPIQHGFTSVVAVITPVGGSDGSTSVTPAVESTAPSSSASEPTGASSTESSQATTSASTSAVTPAAPTSDAPKNFGQSVSSLAHERNDARKSAHHHGSDDAEATSTEAPSTESEAPDSESGDDSGEHSSDGQHSGSGDQSGHGDH